MSSVPQAVGSAADAGADLVQLREERQVERAAQEVDAGRPAGPGLLPDGALDDLQVTEAPLLEVVLEVDELLARLIDAPVLVGLGVHPGEHVDQALVQAVGLCPVTV